MTVAPWQAQEWSKLVERRARGNVPHALLLSGAPHIGKRAFAEQAAAMLLCEQDDDAPCGRCRSCKLFALRTQRDPEETRPDGTPAHPYGHPGHPDARFVGYVLNDKASPKKMYTELVVEQIRDLSTWLALPPQMGRAQVALIDPADGLNGNAANALLKTLEEPGVGRHLILVSSKPAQLPATIRSRCQRIDFRLPAPAQALAWLAAQGIDAKTATPGLAASGGNPGLALTWTKSGGLALRGDVAADLRALHAGKTTPLEVANRWSKADAETRLWFAAALAQEQAHAQAQGIAGPLALTSGHDFTKLMVWFDQANRARAHLRGPLRPELVLLEVLSTWGASAPRGSGMLRQRDATAPAR
ncbi:MAG: DNA polymerase III subunit delta' [Rudaea sp.]|nr:DNA polymerase III subunit delta' [Rudaea sp.]